MTIAYVPGSVLGARNLIVGKTDVPYFIVFMYIYICIYTNIYNIYLLSSSCSHLG